MAGKGGIRVDILKLLQKINQSMDNSDLVSARKYIEENMELLSEHKNLLKRNVRELLEVLSAISSTEVEPLNRQELNNIYSINSYASQFDLSALKRSIQNNAELLMREDIKHYLNADAKVLLEGMSAL